MFHEVIRVISYKCFILPKMSGCDKNFKVKDEDKVKNIKLMSFRTDDDKLLEKYKSIWTKIEGL